MLRGSIMLLQLSGMMCGATLYSCVHGLLLHNVTLHHDLEAMSWHKHVLTWHATRAALPLQCYALSQQPVLAEGEQCVNWNNC